MANPTPPEPPRRLESDEWIAIFVTLAVLGGLGVWLVGGAGLRRIAPSQIAGFDIPGLAEDEERPRAGRDEADEGALFGFGEESRARTRRDSSQDDRPAWVPRRQRTEEESRRSRRRDESEDSRRSRRGMTGARAGAVGTGLILGEQARTALNNQEPIVGVRPDVNDRLDQPVSFADVGDDHWAKAYIDAMSARGLIGGVDPDRFAPDEPVTRAQYARLVEQVFRGDGDFHESLDFVDIDDDYWATSAIETSVRWGFLHGYPGLEFRPERSISRLEVLLSLRSGLNLSEPDDPETILEAYGDRDTVPDWARSPVSAAVKARLERSQPDSQGLDLERDATRAEVTAMFYQALVEAGYAEPLP